MAELSTVVDFVQGAFGHYPATLELAKGVTYVYDCVIANSFGTETGDGSANAEIRYYADNAAASGEGCRLIMDRMLANSYTQSTYQPDLIVDGPITGEPGGIGTFGVLEASAAYMKRHGLKRPLLVGHAVHVYRTALQAKRLGMDPIIARDLPFTFDRDSRQIWTRSLAFWVPYELTAAVWLKIKGKL